LYKERPDGRLKVILSDFGLAARLADEEEMDRRCGSPGYIAPEILKKEPYDERVDSFSLGIVFYQLLTGVSPLRHPELTDTLAANRRAELPLDPMRGLSANAIHLIMALCDRNPSKRLTCTAALSHPFVTGVTPVIWQPRDAGHTSTKPVREEWNEDFDTLKRQDSCSNSVVFLPDPEPGPGVVRPRPGESFAVSDCSLAPLYDPSSTAAKFHSFGEVPSTNSAVPTDGSR
jgi:serine/threonine protein kinase